MKYKIGDRVFIKPWKLMEQEYSLDSYGNIKVEEPVCFTPGMERSLTGRNRIALIKNCRKIYVGDIFYDVVLDGENQNFSWGYSVSDNMIAGYAFDYGEEIEVADSLDDWRQEKRISLGLIPGVVFPYIAKDITHGDKNPYFSYYRYARPLPKKSELGIDITVRINGKDAKLSDISEETLRNIRNNKS